MRSSLSICWPVCSPSCKELDELLSNKQIVYEFAGGTVGNTLHNYSLLADDASILLGVMSEEIRLGTSGYRYLSNTSSRVNLDHLQPVDGPIGRCFALVTPDGERTFAIYAGQMNELRAESIPPEVFAARQPGPLDAASQALLAPLLEKAALTLAINDAWMMLAVVTAVVLISLPFCRKSVV